MAIHTYDEIIMKLTFCFLVEMSNHNKKLRIFCPQFITRNVLVKLLAMEFKLTKIESL
jgi:hypothetical protein